MTPPCHCKIENDHIVFYKLHTAAGGLYAAVDYVGRMLPTFTPEEKDRNEIEQIILPYLDRQLKGADDQ